MHYTGKTHGHSRGDHGKPTKTYVSWKAMRARCEKVTHHNFHNYGGRGIKVCERWLKFENFLADMGERPEGMTIERKETDGGYELDNCVWGTDSEQRHNRRDNVVLALNGLTDTVTNWAKRIGIDRRTIFSRLKIGWPIADTLMKPARKYAPKTTK